MTTTIILNGDSRECDAGTTVTSLVAGLGHDPSLPGVAVAVDGEVIRRVDWDATMLDSGATVEVVTAVQGGG